MYMFFWSAVQRMQATGVVLAWLWVLAFWAMGK
jgi:hypothetical protein